MTGDEIMSMDRKVSEAKALNGRIAIVREQLAWLDRDKLYLAFDRGASGPGVTNAQRVPIVMSDEIRSSLAAALRSQFETELKKLTDEFSAMRFHDDP